LARIKQMKLSNYVDAESHPLNHFAMARMKELNLTVRKQLQQIQFLSGKRRLKVTELK
jgi:hypothetical protein